MRDVARLHTLSAISVAAFFVGIGYGASFPLFAVRLEALGISGLLIGLNASMPALGWLLGSLAAPRLQSAFGIRRVALGFIAAGIAALVATSLVTDYWTSTFLRFFFGGGIGMFLRSLEYWINGITTDDRRGRSIANYNVSYVLGLVAGTLILPELGVEGWGVFGPIASALVVAGLIIWLVPKLVPNPQEGGAARFSPHLIAAAPAAFVAILAYGTYEDIPVYLTSIYALKNGLGPDVAAFTLTAATLGNLVFPLPIATLSDRVGRTSPLVVCAAVVVLMSFAIPFTLHDARLFLGAIFVWAGCAGTVYSLVLALLGDKFKGAALVTANATFGLVYATGQLIGPLINGAALDTLNTHGVMASAAAIFSVLLITLALLGFSERRKTA